MARRTFTTYPSRGPATYAQMRTLILGNDPTTLHLAPTATLPHVWAVLLETRVGQGVATLVAVADGSVSLYASTGGGVIGGGQHITVRAASRRFLECAEASIALFEPRESFAPPMPERVLFIVLTYDQKLAADAPDAEVKAGTHPLSPCYTLAQDVITELRLASGG